MYMSHHACTVSLYIIYRADYSCFCHYFQFLILVIILFLLFQCPTHAVSTFSYSLFYCSFTFVCLPGPLLTDHYYFSVFRSKSWYSELIVEHIVVLLFWGEFSLFPFLACLIQIWWIISFMILCFIYVLLSLRLVIYHTCVLSCSLLTT